MITAEELLASPVNLLAHLNKLRKGRRQYGGE